MAEMAEICVELCGVAWTCVEKRGEGHAFLSRIALSITGRSELKLFPIRCFSLGEGAGTRQFLACSEFPGERPTQGYMRHPSNAHI